MVTAHATRNAMGGGGIEKETQHGLSTVIVMDTNAKDKARISIDKAMDDNLPMN